MKKTRSRHPVALACQLSVLTLALAALAPLPAAASPYSGVAMAGAQTNPCAPTRPANPCAPRKATPANPCAPRKAAPANPCAPHKVAPTNPCAPKAASKTTKTQKADKNCTTGPVNPCAPVPKCDKDGQP